MLDRTSSIVPMSVRNAIEITIPILNEAANLQSQVVRVIEFIHSTPALVGRVSFCLADNGSTDATLSIARQLAKQYSNVRCVSVERPGVGLALRASWQSSKAEYIGYMDLDLATDLGHLLECVGVLESGSADVVTGSRLLEGSVVEGRSFRRDVVSRTFNLMMGAYFETTLRDTTCGFKFMRRSVLDSVINHGACSDGWFFCPELLIVAETIGLKVKEIPVRWTDDPESKVKVCSLSLEYLIAMRALKRRLGQGQQRMEADEI